MGIFDPNAERPAWQRCEPPCRAVFEKAIAEPKDPFVFSRREIAKLYRSANYPWKEWQLRRLSEFHNQEHIDIPWHKYYSRRGLTAEDGYVLLSAFNAVAAPSIRDKFNWELGFSESSLAALDLYGTIPYSYAMKAIGLNSYPATRGRSPWANAHFFQAHGDSIVRFSRVKEQAKYPWINARLVYREEVIEAYEGLIAVYGENGEGDRGRSLSRAV